MRKSRKIIIRLVLFFFSVSAFAGSKVCLRNEIPVYCEKELEGLNSLNGRLYFKGQYFEFSARRAFSKSWCESIRQKIQKVMSDGEFCMTFEEQLSERDLTLNSVKGPKDSWSYFK